MDNDNDSKNQITLNVRHVSLKKHKNIIFEDLIPKDKENIVNRFSII